MEELLQNHLFATHAIAAAASVTLGTAITYPLDTIKTLIQVGSGPKKQLTAAQVFNRVRNSSGILGCYGGLGWSTVGRIGGLGARFGTYEILAAFVKDGREDNYVFVQEAFLAGMAAGAMESLISSPFELIKLREQVTSASRIPRAASIAESRAVAPVMSKLLHGYTPDIKALNHSVGLLSILNTKHPNMISSLQEYPWMMTGTGKPPPVWNVRRPSDIISFEGFGALWKGLRSGIVRDSVFCGIFFSSWQFLHQVMLNWKAAGMNPPPRLDAEIGPLSPLGISLAAGFSGTIASAASHCFDTAKSRAECTVLPKFTILERRLLRWKTPGKRFEKMVGIHPADRKLLYRGIGVRMAYSGLASFLVVGTYYLAVDLLVPK